MDPALDAADHIAAAFEAFAAEHDNDNGDDFEEPWERWPWQLRPFVLAEGNSAYNNHAKNTETTFAEFSHKLKNAPVGPKDGSCYLQGAVTGNVRKDEAMCTMCVVVLDSDEGQDPQEIIARARALGLYVLIHSTHSSTPECLRYRIIVPLAADVPADKDQWKRGYRACGTLLGVRYDPSGSGLSHLFFYPRHPDDQKPWCLETPGEPVPFAFLLACADVIEAADKKSKAGDERKKAEAPPTLVTRNLWRFAVTCGPLFDIEGCYSHHAPDDVRGAASGGGLHCRCPNEGGEVSGRPHTEQGPNVTAFRVINPWNNKGGEGWTAHCLTGGCTEHFAEERLRFLDAMCQQWGIPDAVALLAWCSDPDKARKLYDDWKLTKEELEAERAAILEEMEADGWAATMPDADARAPFMRRVARAWPEPADRKMRARDIAGKYGDLNLKHDFLKEINAAGAAARKDRQPCEHDRPVVNIAQGYEDIVRAVIANVEAAQKDKEDPKQFAREPTLFKNARDAVVRMEGGRIEELGKARPVWRATIEEHTLFENTFGQTTPADNKLLERISGSQHKLKLPGLHRIAHLPVFAPDGTLRTESGYVPELQVYLSLKEEFREVPDVVTEQNVSEALFWLHEAVRDIPFSDYEEEQLPQYTLDVDDDGWPLPNLERGKASRLGFFAMLLQAIVRGMIVGQCPAYHFDKPETGTGASLLIKIYSAILTGLPPPDRPAPFGNPEEIRKQITTALRCGADTLCWDNIPTDTEIDNGDVARMVTSGMWIDRQLSTNNEIVVPITQTIILAGNGLSMSKELRERMVPIFIDANVESPDVARPAIKDGASYKYPELITEFVLPKRIDLVWSLHVLVAYYLQERDAGRHKPVARGGIGSLAGRFPVWQAFFENLFAAVGRDGLLGNRPAYLAKRNDAKDHMVEFALKWFELADKRDRGTVLLSASELFKLLEDDRNPDVLCVALPLGGKDREGRVMSLGRKLAGAVGRVFVREGRKLKIVKARKECPAKYGLVDVGPAEG